MNRALSLAVAALLAAGPAAAQEKFNFALNWFAVGDHAAYWVALEKGYYKAKGLDVTLENSKGSGDSIAKVDTGRADAGLADAAVVIASNARGTKSGRTNSNRRQFAEPSSGSTVQRSSKTTSKPNATRFAM